MNSLTFLCLCALICFVYGQCNEGEPRLVQTRNVGNSIGNAGRLEVCLNGQWGTIAADSFTTPWSEKNAQVACRQLGFSGVLNSVFQNTTLLPDRAGSSVPVHYSRVVCGGTERRLENCSLNRVSGSIDHLSDVFIVCRPTFDISLAAYSDLHTPGPNAGDIRLLGSPDNGAGAVEIYTDNVGWTGICPDSSWTSEDAGVICRALGYFRGEQQTFQITNGAIERRQATDIQCTDERENRPGFVSAGVCSLSLFGSCSAREGSYAGVVCFSSDDPPETYRLFRTTTEQHQPLGIVEVLFNGRWGVVCDRQFFTSEAEVMCRHLGFNSDGARTLSSIQVEGTLRLESSLKPLWLNNINCFSSSTNDITLCQRDPVVGFADCRSDDIIAIECGDNSGSSFSSGAIFGIVFGVAVVIFVLFPLVWVFGKDWWSKRHNYSWYRCLTTPSDWCDCDCFSRSPRRNFELTRPVEEITITHTHIPDAPQTQSQPDTSSDSEPELTHEPQDPKHESSLTKAPPPSYRAASDYPEHTPTVDDLPPPYPGGPVPAFAYPPPQASAPYPSGEATPYPPPTTAPYPSGPAAPYPSSAPGNEQQYPPPTNPGYPPAQPYSDPAYPPVPPAASSEGLPYPPDVPYPPVETAETNLPYP